MAAKLIELTAIYLREKPGTRRGDWCVVECDLPEDAENAVGSERSARVVGTFEEDELQPHLTYRFYGRWKEHEKYGRQFDCQTFVRCEPYSRAGVLRYLQATCPRCGLGPATAAKLWDKFHGDAVRIVREQPEVAVAAVDLPSFTEADAKRAAAFLAREKDMEGCHLEMMDLLAGRGFRKDTGKRVIRDLGNKAPRLIARNPLLLLGFGCGFGLVDKMYLALGFDPAKLKRQSLCAWHAMHKDTEGHTWHRPEVVEKHIKDRIAGAEPQSVAAIKLACRAGLVAVHRNGDGRPWLAEGGKARNEAYVAEKIVELSKSPALWPDVGRMDVSPHQRDRLREALAGSVAILGGSPGTGKTYTAARVIKAAIEMFGEFNVAVCAPTGKAAVRISEAMQAYGIQVRARTIHSLLGIAKHSASGDWGFLHDESNPLPHRLVVVDEKSMVDVDLEASLLRACGPGTQLLFVGDVNQLPPVGHGRPLYDMIAAGIPYGELREIRRNSGAIVEACSAIRDRQRMRFVDRLDPDAGENLDLAFAVGGDHSAHRIVETLKAVRQRKILDAIWQCQVIVAVNAKSPLSRAELNKRLQAELNPLGRKTGGNPFRVGDKIVCLKNGFVPLANDGGPCGEDFGDVQFSDGGDDVFVANGEQACVLEVAEKYTIAKLTAPHRVVRIPRGQKKDGEGGEDQDSEDASVTGCNWDLAYAISCHKSQGSEWPMVLVALDEYAGARMVCSRNWLYTAISRAKLACRLVGRRETAESMCRRDAISGRKTFLKELIVEKQNAKEM